MSTTALATPEPSDDDARTGTVIDFPTPAAGQNEPVPAETPSDSPQVSEEPGKALVPAGPVLDADLVEDEDDRVAVDTPTTLTRESWSVAALTARSSKLSPIIPGWARSGAEFKGLVKWGAAYAAHTTGYHAVRVPGYAARLALRSPRGACRVIGGAARWAFDMESKPLRANAIQLKDADAFEQLSASSRDRIRKRLGLVLLGAVLATAGVLVLLGYAPTYVQWLAAMAGIGVLGWIGTPADRPLFDAAATTEKVAKLTSDVIVRALGSLGIAQINQAMTKGSGVTFTAPITRDGPGWRAEVDLPYGVTVTDVMDKRDKLASGLRRPMGCVWPQPENEEHPGRLVLWVGDKPLSQVKPGVWPLAKNGAADLFKPVPFGCDERGRAVAILLMFANVLIGSMPRYGKTFALRVLMLAAALDPIAELRIFELKGTGDLGALAKCSHHYASGADDATLLAALESLREVDKELETRAKTIQGLPASVCPENKVTPELARRKNLGLHPLVLTIDECQELFSNEKYSKEAEELALAIIKRGPALGIILILATQRPDAKSLPPGVSANIGIRFCLRVMGQLENDMVLGTSSYKNGVRATSFTMKDKGIGYLVGAAEEPQIVRGDYIDAPDAEKISQRARALREAAGTLTGHAIGQTQKVSTTSAPDALLTDILTVVGANERKVWSETVVSRLVEAFPDEYSKWAEMTERDDEDASKERATTLAAALKPFGIKTGQVWSTAGDGGESGNRRGITRSDIVTAIAERNQK